MHINSLHSITFNDYQHNCIGQWILLIFRNSENQGGMKSLSNTSKFYREDGVGNLINNASI